ncbi:MAG TPA: alkaline phosphatase family protein, partial [Bryobacterales bacterium]|nr:alkaline phosphatase family protein [Bryobacterales bacterium]
MTTRRHFLRHSVQGAAAAALASKASAAPRRKILIVLVDGFGPEYLEASDMPNLKRMGREGASKIGRAVIPSVTNVNNASLVTGCFPSEHGITTNYYYDRETKTATEMESAEFLLRPTIFEKARALGWRSALVASKDKVRTLCSRGADIALSAENPPPEYVQKIGKQENIYSAEVNYWSLRAARYILKNDRIDLLYLSTTDYMMHTYAPDAEPSLEHLHRVDKLLGEIVGDHPRLEVYLTADHGMNAKRRAADPARILKANAIEAYVEPIIRDKHTVHHQNLGGSCYVFLNRPADRSKAYEVLKGMPEVEEIYEAPEAARLFHLYPRRIGDLFLLAPQDTAFGELEQSREPVRVRSHGSRHEARAPLVAYGR